MFDLLISREEANLEGVTLLFQETRGYNQGIVDVEMGKQVGDEFFPQDLLVQDQLEGLGRELRVFFQKSLSTKNNIPCFSWSSARAWHREKRTQLFFDISETDQVVSSTLCLCLTYHRWT